MKNVFAYSCYEFKSLPIDFNNTVVLEIVGPNDLFNEFIYEENNQVCHVWADDLSGNWISQSQLDEYLDTFINDRMNYSQNIFVNDHNEVALDYQEAFNVVRFINKVMNDSKIKNIFIHCSAGASRSQAIVRYIKDIYKGINIRKENPCLTPNMWIVMMLKRVYRNFI